MAKHYPSDDEHDQPAQGPIPAPSTSWTKDELERWKHAQVNLAAARFDGSANPAWREQLAGQMMAALVGGFAHPAYNLKGSGAPNMDFGVVAPGLARVAVELTDHLLAALGYNIPQPTKGHRDDDHE